ncbi:MAG: sigma-70 family RNA polymerase sigma factor [Bacillota bacterium]|nr:sigma-70 family RNA polymerase sigma factor [Bacillota bacterium]
MEGQAELFRRARAGDEEAALVLLARHQGLVFHVARRFPVGPQEREDLLQAGRLALWQAISRFDPDRGVSFATYAVPLILGEVRSAWQALQGPLSLPRRQARLLTRVREVRRRLLQELGREPTLKELAEGAEMSPTEVASLSLHEGTPLSLEDLAHLQDSSDPGLFSLAWSLFREGLPPLERDLLRLRFEEGLSQKEVARSLGVSQAQVSRRENALRQRLRDDFGVESSS